GGCSAAATTAAISCHRSSTRSAMTSTASASAQASSPAGPLSTSASSLASWRIRASSGGISRSPGRTRLGPVLALVSGAGRAGHGDAELLGDLEQQGAGLLAVHGPDPVQQLGVGAAAGPVLQHQGGVGSPGGAQVSGADPGDRRHPGQRASGAAHRGVNPGADDLVAAGD